MFAVEQQLKVYESSNIPESYNEWVSTSTYAFGDIIRYGNYYYRSIIDNNVGNTPEYGNDEFWLTWRVSNAYAMLDEHSSTKTIVNETGMTPKLTLNVAIPYKTYIDAMGFTQKYDVSDVMIFSGLWGSKLTITRDSVGAGDIPIPKVYDLGKAEKDSLFFTFNSNMEDDKWYPTSTPPPSPETGNTYTIEIEPYRGRVEVANFVMGMRRDMGETLFGFKNSFEDNSIWQKDDFGVSSNIYRLSEEVYSGDVIYGVADYTKIRKNIRNIMGRVMAFVADEQNGSKIGGVVYPDSHYGNLVVVGKLDSFTPITSNCVQTKASVQVRELI